MAPDMSSAGFDLLDQRLDALEGKIDDLVDPDERHRFTVLSGVIRARAAQLADSHRESNDDETHGVVQSLLRVVDEMAVDVDDEMVVEGIAGLTRHERALRRWTSIVDELRVQSRLGRMDADDGFSQLTERSRRVWHDVVWSTRTATDDLRRDVDAVIKDARDLGVELRESAQSLIRGDS